MPVPTDDRRPLSDPFDSGTSTDPVDTNAPGGWDAPAAPAFGPPAEPGEVGTLGHFRVVKELGRGGMGAVYAAIDTRLSRKLALKVMLPRFAADPEARQRFLREARAAAGVTHDNVVTVYEADERDGIPYIAMQFLEGYSLDEFLRKKGTPTFPQVLRIAREAAAGLAAAHKLGLVHRDIKPGNLWLEAPNGRVKVLDFGLAKAFATDVQLTLNGAILGTPAYMPPEQAHGQKVDGRSDLFSLGAVLYQLVTGRLPFEGPNKMAVLMALATTEPRPVRELNPAVPEPLAALIDQLLAKTPGDRPRSAAEVVRRVRDIAEGRVPAALPAECVPNGTAASDMPVTVVPGDNPFVELDLTELEPAQRPRPTVPAESRSNGKRWVWFGVGGVAVALLVAGGIALGTRKKGGGEPKTDPGVVAADNGGRPAAGGRAGRPTSADPPPDRKVAEWLLLVGAVLKVNGEAYEVRTVGELPREQFRVTEVSLEDREVSDAELAHLDGLRGLTYLNLHGTRTTDAGLIHLRTLTGLTELGLYRTRVSGTGLAHLKDLRRLAVLHMQYTDVTDAGLAPLRYLTALTYLDLKGTRTGDAGLSHLKGLTALNQLELYETDVTDAGLRDLTTLTRLGRLDVRKTKVTPAGATTFHAAVPGCQVEYDGGVLRAEDPDRTAAEWAIARGGTVRVKGSWTEIKVAADLPRERFALGFVNLEGRRVADAELANLKGCMSLTGLGLSNTKVTDAGLATLEGFKDLTWVTLTGLAVTDAGLAHLRDLKALAHLDLGATAVTDAGLAHLAGCEGLDQLLLHYTRVTGTGLADLKQCPVLHSLVLKYSQLTDTGLVTLKDYKGLDQIDLRGTGVTDAGLARLTACKGLTSLYVQMTKVSAEGLKAFHAARPGCKVEHDGGVIEPK